VLINGPAAGKPPGTHAFIVGVSAYPFADGPDATASGGESGIANLTCAARSASEVAAWLLGEYNNLDAPLASLRILLSPVDGEQINPDVCHRRIRRQGRQSDCSGQSWLCPRRTS
jgi:hypothetical protein